MPPSKKVPSIVQHSFKVRLRFVQATYTIVNFSFSFSHFLIFSFSKFAHLLITSYLCPHKTNYYEISLYSHCPTNSY